SAHIRADAASFGSASVWNGLSLAGSFAHGSVIIWCSPDLSEDLGPSGDRGTPGRDFRCAQIAATTEEGTGH
ncbi:MAG: hypothetical protein ACE5JS_21370, partial [Nitrospinota bacterium]